MDLNDIYKGLQEITGELEGVPSKVNNLEDVTNKPRQAKPRKESAPKNIEERIGDQIDYLRLSVKYLLFDLEASRRENGYLRKMIEEDRGE